VLQASTTDSTFATGKIGFSTTNALATLDNVTVTTLAAAQTKPGTASIPSAVRDAVFAQAVEQSLHRTRWS
jgi:hypothetical protein